MEVETIDVDDRLRPINDLKSNDAAVEQTENIDDSDEHDMINELASDYSNYLDFETPKEKVNFDESIEDMLTRLDEYCGLVDMIRSDTSLCLNKNMLDLNQKSKQMQQIFDRIDKLEEFVGHVRQNVSAMEDLVNKAEDEMGTFSNIKKMITSISLPTFIKKPSPSKPRSDMKPKFIPPEIFCTDDYFGPKGAESVSEDRMQISAEVVVGEA